MKTTILTAACLLPILLSATQELSAPAEQSYLAEQAKKQKNSAVLMTVAGSTITIGGGILIINDLSKDISNIIASTPDEKNANVEWGVGMVITGVICLAGGISLFNASKKNKNNSVDLVFKNEFTPISFPFQPIQGIYPALSLRLKL